MVVLNIEAHQCCTYYVSNKYLITSIHFHGTFSCLLNLQTQHFCLILYHYDHDSLIISYAIKNQILLNFNNIKIITVSYLIIENQIVSNLTLQIL